MEIYEQLWGEAVSALSEGRPQIDAHLSNKAQDARRGVTLIARPSAAVQSRVKCFLDCLALEFSGQYFYLPEELHVTVLSIVSGSVHWRKEMRRLPVCRAIIKDVLSRQSPFKIRFQGVTASPAAVMIQGFPLDGTLSKIRDDLRQAFAQAGLEGQLDRRYRISTAHLTVMRFAHPQGDWKRLVSMLEEHRQTDFGESEVEALRLIWGDWYASAPRVRRLAEYRLPKRPAM